MNLLAQFIEQEESISIKINSIGILNKLLNHVQKTGKDKINLFFTSRIVNTLQFILSNYSEVNINLLLFNALYFLKMVFPIISL